MKKISKTIIILILFLISPITLLAEEFPKFPMAFYGDAKLNGKSLEVGTTIKAYDGDELIGEIELLEDGVYGFDNPTKSKLLVKEFQGEYVAFKYLLPSSQVLESSDVELTYETTFQEAGVVNFDLNFAKAPPVKKKRSGGGSRPVFRAPEVDKEQVQKDIEELKMKKERVLVLGVEYEYNKKDIDNIIRETILKEKKLFGKKNFNLLKRLKGRILLQVEERGEAWYVNPKDEKKYYMANGAKAYEMMRFMSIGITDKNLNRISSDKNFAKKHSGKIFLQVEKHGEAYYIGMDGVAYYLKNGDEAYNVMRNLGLGITNSDLREIEVGDDLN